MTVKMRPSLSLKLGAVNEAPTLYSWVILAVTIRVVLVTTQQAPIALATSKANPIRKVMQEDTSRKVVGSNPSASKEFFLQNLC